jgi:hypothetical protein
MRFIDDEGADSRLDARALQRTLEKVREQQPLGREVHELEFAAQHACDASLNLIARERRIDEGRGNAVVLEQAHLVLHQGNERRDDDAYPRLQ